MRNCPGVRTSRYSTKKYLKQASPRELVFDSRRLGRYYSNFVKTYSDFVIYHLKKVYK